MTVAVIDGPPTSQVLARACAVVGFMAEVGAAGAEPGRAQELFAIWSTAETDPPMRHGH